MRVMCRDGHRLGIVEGRTLHVDKIPVSDVGGTTTVENNYNLDDLNPQLLSLGIRATDSSCHTNKIIDLPKLCAALERGDRKFFADDEW